MSIPVICDRCRSVGNSGEGDFSHLGDLLDFEPVPRRPRVNGWNAEAQRAFIAALAMTGSKTRAARSIGRNPFGIDQLLKAEGSEGFRLAYDRAMAIAAKNGSMRIATGVADAAARNAWIDQRSALRGLDPDANPDADADVAADDGLGLLLPVLNKFLAKLRAEREARLAGRIIEADFYVRQITALEVMFDLLAMRADRDSFDALRELHKDDYLFVEIAETLFSRLLDRKRRELWEDMAEPERPEHPPKRYLVDLGDFSVMESEHVWGGPDEEREAQRRKFEARHAADAELQMEWEAKARREYEERRESGASSSA